MKESSGLARVFWGEEIPHNFHIFTKYWHEKPEDGDLIGEVFWPLPHAFLYWMRGSDGKEGVHMVGKKPRVPSRPVTP